MDKAAKLVDLKCGIVCNFIDEKKENDYMIETCNNLGDRDQTTKENSLLIDLLEHEEFLNYKDNCGKKVIGCNFRKIKELY